MESTYSGRGTIACIKVIELGHISHRFPTEEIFQHLELLTDFLRSSSQKFSGLTCGSLSSGFYVFFGWGASKTSDPLEHTSQALKWGQYIQTYIAEEIASNRGNIPPLLLRVSLSTGFFHIQRESECGFKGLICDDFPLIEQSTDLCGINGLIFNEKFLRALSQHGISLQNVHKIREKFSHHANPLTFFEYTVVSPDSNLNRKVVSCIKGILNRRDGKRWSCEDSIYGIKLLNSGTEYHLTNLSTDGLEVSGNQSETTGAVFKFHFTGPDHILNQLQANDLNIIEAQVRWQKQDGGIYRLGLKIENLSHNDREEIVRILLNHRSNEQPQKIERSS